MITINGRSVLASLFTCLCLTATTPPLAAADPEAIVVSTVGDEVTIDGAEIVLVPAVADLVKAWGEPSRTKNLVNDIRIWDDLGIRTYSSTGSPSVDSISFTMREREDFELAAKTPFAGRILLNTGTITKESTVDDLDDHGFTPHEVLTKMRELDLFTVSFLAETDEESGELVSLSMSFGL